jgi:lysophospholipase L1-like esterase
MKLKIRHFCSLAFLYYTVAAQNYQLKEIPKYSHIEPAVSAIVYPGGDTTAYYGFFEKLDKLISEGEGNVTILHLGGSHIQAGTLTHKVRSNLLGMAPNIVGSRGMLFPFTAARTNNPYNYITTYQGNWEVSRNSVENPPFGMGLSGITIATSDTAAYVKIEMRNTEELAFDFNSIYVLGHSKLGNMSPVIHIGDSILLEGIFDAKRLAYKFDLEEKADAFKLSFRLNKSLQKRDMFYLRGFWAENNMPGITYADIGVNGASVPSYLKCFYFESDLQFVKPDLCIFSIGINDASDDNFKPSVFESNYKKLIQKIKKASPDCAILFITNNDNYKRTRGNYQGDPDALLARKNFYSLGKYNKFGFKGGLANAEKWEPGFTINLNTLTAQNSFYALGKYYKTGVWDLFETMGGLTSIENWEQDSLARTDKIHFTTKGYTLLGDLFYNAILSEYIKYLEAKDK